MRALRMAWSAHGQRIACDGEEFAHDGPIHTDPSHDCAHLLVAAASDLPWRPVGEDAHVRLAEYNATILEHLLDEVHNAGALHAVRPSAIQPIVGTYAEWFVETHFAPFPVGEPEARRCLAWGLDQAALVRLSPYFFAMKRAERAAARQVRADGVDLAFDSDGSPGGDAVTRALQSLLAEHLRLFLDGVRCGGGPAPLDAPRVPDPLQVGRAPVPLGALGPGGRRGPRAAPAPPLLGARRPLPRRSR